MLSSFSSNHHGLISVFRGVIRGVLQQESALPPEALGGWTPHRTATKKAGGTAKQSVGSQPKHLGMKMFDGELVFPGMILVRQRGTKFHPGENVGIGRDHTIFATNVGTVRVSPAGREGRRYVNVDPLPEVLAAAAARAQMARAANEGPQSLRTYQSIIVDELVKRRAAVKRAMLRGGAPLEPALFFNLPRHADGKLTWLERTTPKVNYNQPPHTPPQKQ